MKFNLQVSTEHEDIITCISLSVVTATKSLLYKTSEGNENFFGEILNGDLKMAHNLVSTESRVL